MRTLALSDEILMKVDKAARYIGGEVNSVMKDKNAVDIRFAMCFPDVYEIGMSNLGMMILYNMFNQREDVWCERLFSPWPDLDKVMREEKIPLFALESQEPIRDFDFLGITIGYEMCYTNILQVLDLSGIPLKSADRGEDFPIVIGGGACAYNPEPLAPFFDMFYIGEGETVYDALFDAYKANKKAGGSRKDFLLAAAKIPGIYVPSLYEVTYKEDGTIASFAPTADGVPEKVQKQLIIDMEKEYRAVEAPVVPHIKATEDTESSESTDSSDQADSAENDTSVLSEEAKNNYDKFVLFVKGEYEGDAESLLAATEDTEAVATVILDEQTAKSVAETVEKDYYDILKDGTESYEADGTEKYQSTELNMMDQKLKKLFGIDSSQDDTDATDVAAAILADVPQEDKQTLYKETMKYLAGLYGENTDASEESAAE